MILVSFPMHLFINFCSYGVFPFFLVSVVYVDLLLRAKCWNGPNYEEFVLQERSVRLTNFFGNLVLVIRSPISGGWSDGSHNPWHQSCRFDICQSGRLLEYRWLHEGHHSCPGRLQTRLPSLTWIFASSHVGEMFFPLPYTAAKKQKSSLELHYWLLSTIWWYFCILTQAMRQGSALVRITYKNNPQIVDWILVSSALSQLSCRLFPRSRQAHLKLSNRCWYPFSGILYKTHKWFLECHVHL